MKVERLSGTIISIPWDDHQLLAFFHNVVTHEKHLVNKPVILRLHGALGNLLDESEHDLPFRTCPRGLFVDDNKYTSRERQPFLRVRDI